MRFFSDIQSIDALKQRYRQLAARHHPDRGGNTRQMCLINDEYQHYLSLLRRHKMQASQHQSAPRHQQQPYSAQQEDFKNIQVGHTVYVNGTECEVIRTTEQSFRVVAKGRNRQALINKDTGLGLFNRRLHASYHDNHPRRQHATH